MAYRKIEDTKLKNIADAIRIKLDSTVTMSPDEMPLMIENIGIGIVPDYWKNELESKATEINSAIDNAGENKSAFLWYTDAHWEWNYGMSPMILKYLNKNTDMQKTFYGGDISNINFASEDTEETKQSKIDSDKELVGKWQNLVKDIPNHHSVVGNHDSKIHSPFDGNIVSDFFLSPERTGDVVLGANDTYGKAYYYIDNHIEKTRYICLSTGKMWTYSDEVEWCIDTLLNTPKNWHIVIISHIWLNSSSGIINTTPVEYTQGYLDMFDDYNHRLSGTESCTNRSYDFASAEAKIEFIIGGHVHQDYDFTTSEGIPVILTECDCWEERDEESTAVQGTVTENCVYAIVADYDAKSVNVINIGRGDTRSLAIPVIATYTNWAKKAYSGADMTVYNDGKGYKDDVRINSSGTDTDATGWDTTGYIPVKTGDIIRLKNCTVFNMSGITGTNRCRPVFYNESFAYVTESTAWSLDKTPPMPDAYTPVYGDNGDVIQFVVPTSYSSGIRYMRITMDDINENSIITVNEEIPE
jgi:hypothetical protein